MDLNEWLEEDWIQNIYYGNTFLAEKIPDYAEYDAIIKKRDKLFAKITNENESIKKELNTYNEYSSIKESIEAEFEFKLGFKTAVCLIIQGLKKE